MIALGKQVFSTIHDKFRICLHLQMIHVYIWFRNKPQIESNRGFKSQLFPPCAVEIIAAVQTHVFINFRRKSDKKGGD